VDATLRYAESRAGYKFPSLELQASGLSNDYIQFISPE
jgi:hypothetical protein